MRFIRILSFLASSIPALLLSILPIVPLAALGEEDSFQEVRRSDAPEAIQAVAAGLF